MTNYWELYETAAEKQARKTREDHEDRELAADEAEMRQRFGPAYDEHRIAILRYAVERDNPDLEEAIIGYRAIENAAGRATDLLDFAERADLRADRRADRLEELHNKFSPSDQLEREAIKRDALEDGEKVLEQRLKAQHREETRREQIGNINRAAAIRNDERTYRASVGKIDSEPQKRRPDRDELDMQAETIIRQAISEGDPDRPQSGGMGSDPLRGL